MVWLFTVIVQVAFKEESLVLTAVIVVVPAFWAVTSPLLLTVAIAMLLLLHVTPPPIKEDTVAFSCNVCPTYKFREVPSREKSNSSISYLLQFSADLYLLAYPFGTYIIVFLGKVSKALELGVVTILKTGGVTPCMITYDKPLS